MIDARELWLAKSIELYMYLYLVIYKRSMKYQCIMHKCMLQMLPLMSMP